MFRASLPTALLLSLYLTPPVLAWPGGGDDYRQPFHFAYDLKPGGSFEIENHNGPIEISGWDKDRVEIDGEKYSSSSVGLNEIQIRAEQSGQSIRVRTEYPDRHNGDTQYGARYVIHVPRRIQLQRVQSSNGGLKLTGLETDVNARTSNGGIKLSDVKGTLDVHTSNGGITIDHCSGPAKLESSNGGIVIDHVSRALTAVTSNGPIRATLDPDAGQQVRAETSNGPIDLRLEHLRNNPIDASSSNGLVTIHLPADGNAVVEASTSHSNIVSDFGESSSGRSSRGWSEPTSLRFTLGNGGGTIRLSTSNNPVRILKN